VQHAFLHQNPFSCSRRQERFCTNSRIGGADTPRLRPPRLALTPDSLRIHGRCYHALVDWFSGSRFEVCLIKTLLWHGVLGVVAALVFWLIEYVNHKLGVRDMLLFSFGDVAIVITFAVLTSISLVLRCLIVEITYDGIRRR
jgi:hypothetical protein